GSPQDAPTSPPSAAPNGRAPVLTVRNTDDTRPSIACGVTLWRSVVEVMVQMMGPTPNRKNANAARSPVGRKSVLTMVAAAATETAGPNWIARPNAMAPTSRDASSAPTTMPAP